MSRVLVVHPPVSVARDFIDYPYLANLGALQATAVLAERWPVEIVDAYALAGSTLAWRSDGRAHLGAPVAEVLDAARAVAWDLAVVALTPFHRPPRRDDVLGEVLAGLSAISPTAPIVLADCYQSGQHYVEAAGSDVLASYPEAAAWVKYEAERTLPTLIAQFLDGRAPPRQAFAGADVPLLDELPLPAWDRVDLDHYQRFHARVVAHLGRGRWAFPLDGRTLPLVSSRGCPYTCAHCSSNPGRAAGAAKTQRRYSLAYLDRALARLEALGATRIEILDELVNVSERHFDGFLDLVEKHDLAWDAPNGMRADYLEPRHLARMKGRVSTVSVSAESGVQRVVDEIVGKQLDLAAIARVAADAHAAGVPLLVHYIIGLPGETAEEINATLAFAMDLWDRLRAEPAVQFATPLPGTRLATGRSLPLVEDWGPSFQTEPSQPGALVDAATLRAFKRTFDQRLAASRAPEKLVVNVTYVCNNHCTFCAVGTRTQLHGHPTRQREHLDKYRRLGVRMVDFDGGEPTMNPELVPLVRYARSVGYERINVTTNGRMCAYPDFARSLVRSGLTTLLFSLHGPDAQTHAQQVGVAEAFEQTVAGIRNCQTFKPSTVELGVNITLTKGNYARLGEVAELAWSLGVAWLNIQFLTPFGRATRMVAPDTADAARVTAAVIDAWRDRMKLQVINLPFCFLPDHAELLVGDLAKLSRHMVFVNNEDVNLAAYLAERRVRKPECAPCPHAVFCGGFYELDDAPEPPWLIKAEDLVRPVV